MAVSKKRQRAVAIESLGALVEKGMDPKIMEDFERGVISCSQRAVDAGGDTLVVPLDEERLGPIVHGFEAKHGHLVFHAILEEMSFGTMLYLLHVDAYEDGIEADMAELADLHPMVFGANLDAPECSEFGFIPIRISDGGLRYDYQ